MPWAEPRLALSEKKGRIVRTNKFQNKTTRDHASTEINYSGAVINHTAYMYMPNHGSAVTVVPRDRTLIYKLQFEPTQ